MNDVKEFSRSEVLSTFGTKVRSLRISRGLSQEQLADMCGLDRTYIGGVERGERNIGLINIYRLADALQVSPNELLQNTKNLEK